jgi:NADPH-dependent glutamate synthase beta subunit-like oxidoreductase
MIGTIDNPLRVAIIGSGPSGFYAAEALLQSEHLVEVDVLERLPVPYGLVRHGVAPDHPRLKEVAQTYATIATHPRFSFIGNASFGEHFSIDDLAESYHAVVFATGAAGNRKLGIPGEDLPGVHGASSFVGWYNGHPDFRDLEIDLSGESAVIIGQGNVAIDICRILSKSPDELRHTDIASHALDALSESRIREIHLIGRRGPAQARFTTKELREMGQLTACAPFVDPNDLVLNEECESELSDIRAPTRAKNFEVLRTFAGQQDKKSKTCHFHFFLSPREALGEQKLEELLLETNTLVGPAGRREAVGTGRTVSLKTGLLIRSVGYRGIFLKGIPFDDRNGVIPNMEGRVTIGERSGLSVYVTGWIKRGPSGIIGTNRADSIATVATLLEDRPTFSIQTRKTGSAFKALLAQRTHTVSFEGWKSIDRLEKEHGSRLGKPREKFTRIPEMLAASGTHS